MQENLNCAGIYKITCSGNNKFYIGSSNKIRKRFENHRSSLRRNCHYALYMQNSYNKYGVDSFSYEVLEIVDAVEDLIPKEQAYIDDLNPAFNLRVIAESNKGYKIPDVSVARMVDAQHKRSVETVLPNNKTGYTGVSFHKKQKKFNAFITINSTRRVNLGSYNSIEDAILARKEGESLYWGEDFSKLSEEDQNKVLDHNSTIRFDMKNSVPANKFVTYIKRNNKWLLEIKSKNIGRFDSLEDALLARNLLLKLPIHLQKFSIKHFALDLTTTCTSCCT